MQRARATDDEAEHAAPRPPPLDPGRRHRRLQRRIVLLAALALPLVFARTTLSAFGTPKAALGWLLAAAAAAVAVRRAGALRRLTLGRPALVGSVSLLLVGLVIATAAAPSPLRALVGSHGRHVGLLAYVMGAVLMGTAATALRRAPGDSELVTEHPVAALLRALLLACVLVTGYGALQALGMDPFHWSAPAAHPQVFSTLGNENFLAGWLAMAGPVAVWGAVTRTWSGAWRTGCAVLAATAFAVTIATGSAQGPLAWTAGLGVLGAVLGSQRRRRRGRLRGGPLTALALSALLFGLVAGAVSGGDRIAAVVDELGESYRDRTSLWLTAGRMGADHPAVGVGVDAFGDHYLRYRPAERAARYDTVRPVATQAHNVPLHLFAGGGVLPLVGWLAWAAGVVAVGLHGLRHLVGERRLLLGAALAAWTAYVVQSMVSIDMPALLSTGWVAAGAVLAAAPDGATRTRRLPSPAPIVGAVVAVAILAGALLGLQVLLRAELAAGTAARAGGPEVLERSADVALSLAPWEPAYPMAAARRARELGEERRALALLDEVLRRNPRAAEAHHERARIARRLGLADEAAASYRQLARLAPTTPGVLEQAAGGLAAAGEEDEARLLRERAAELRRRLAAR